VVGAYLEFHGEGAARLTLGDRATISNMAPGVRRHRGDVLHRPADLDYLRLTGRDDEQVQAGRDLRQGRPACGPTAWNAQYERVLQFDLSAWCATWPARPTRTSACHQRPGRARHRRQVDEEAGA
jgi:aconitase A